MSAGGDSSDSEPWLALENLPNSIDLVLQSPLASSEPGERLDGHLHLAAGASLVPDASIYAVDEQDWIVACLAGGRAHAWRPAREEPGSRVATNGVCVEVRRSKTLTGLLTARHFQVSPRATQAGVPSGLILVTSDSRSKCSSRPGSRGSD